MQFSKAEVAARLPEEQAVAEYGQDIYHRLQPFKASQQRYEAGVRQRR